MSIIEQSLRKANRGKTGQNTPSSPAREAYRSREPAVPVQVRTYRSATLDRETMERCRIFPEIKDHSALRGYKILRTRVLQRLAANNWRSVGITAPGAGAGKTLTAINLAIALAQDVSTHVFLVDLDLQRPSVARALGLGFQQGLSDYLQGTVNADDIIYDIGIDRISVVPNRTPLVNSSELLGSPRVHELMHMLQSDCSKRVVVFDLPPLLLSDDVLTFAPQIDSLLLVVSEGVTTRQNLEDARQLLQEMNVLGVALNRSTERDDANHYY